MKYNQYFEKISNESFASFSETSYLAVEKIMSDRVLIIDMLNNVLDDEVLINKSECYDFLDKIICYSNDSLGAHMRISLFNNKYANRIHYHRWDYTACVLAGSYTQFFYGLNQGNDITELFPYEPIYVEKHLPNNIYSLSHTIVHSVKAEPDTVSICIRGKAFGDKFQAIDSKTNTSWWQYGSNLEASEERAMKSVSPVYLKDRIEHLISILSV